MCRFFTILIVFVSFHARAQKGYFIKSKDQTPIYIEEKGAGKPVVLLSGGPGLNPNYVYPIHENLSTDRKSVV